MIRRKVMRVSLQLEQQKNIPEFPIEVRPLLRAYFLTSGGFALAPLVGIALSRKIPPVGLLSICLGGAFLMLAYMNNKKIRLDQMGITQGFSVFSTFMRYDEIADVRKETRSFKGASSAALVLSAGVSTRKIAIPLAAFDRKELRQALTAAALVAPQVRPILNALSWVSSDTL